MDGQRIVRKNRGTGTPIRLIRAKGSYTRSGLIIDNMLQKYDTKYDYTPGGNISRKKQSAWGVGTEGNSITDVNLSYDNEYKYDSLKPHAVTKVGSTEYTYDLDGRMTGSYDSESKFKRTFTWDEEGRLLKTVDNKHTTDYRYDANGERICKYSDLGETIYASGYYTETDGKKISKHIYIGSTRVASQVMSRSCETSTTMKRENTLYYHTDHLGSSGYVTDKKGEFYEHTEYTSSGESWVNEKVTGNANLPYKYCLKEMDNETGLYYYGARYYDAKTSRFISPDDRIDGLFSSAGQNMYMYCHGNPIMFNDPDGHGRKEAEEEASRSVTRHGDSNGFKNDGESIDQLRKKAEARIAKYNDGGTIQNSNNCGSYSLDITVDPRDGKNFSTDFDKDDKNFGYQPGMFSGNSLSKDKSNDPETIIKLVKDDVKALNKLGLKAVFKPISAEASPSKGNHKVALFVNADPAGGGGAGYHWMRQDEDGLWSQKMGGRAATNMINFQRVTDPRGINNPPFNKFVGFFEVGGFRNEKYEK